ncbi:hypothetical protein CERZMDRAFT_57621 [Cercospora zeae-maydis SCOH1-5]|uniref:F-box domain-containing protein n=1 Tax=Cercospora zeae-maydis SCOH1-5 TaxID=717836 RepID=A0A6A6FLE6_9PEZI|nr:hypothetical protein CERZMDRAFT_57621 [Cercospora zeae-maydis SCOH1-5]
MTRQNLERRRTIPDLRSSPPIYKQHGFEKMDSNAASKRHGNSDKERDSSKDPSATLKLHQLPEELLQDILERLDRPALKHLSLTCSWCYKISIPHLWREVDLVDCKSSTSSAYLDTLDQPSHDDHDDTPLIKKLFLLATKPHLAEQVHVLTHRCRMPPPAIFHELPQSSFSGMTLSSDPRTIALCKMAVGHMTRVHTLRIILGHVNLVDVLLRGFFDETRAKREGVVRVRRLWLENCRISAGLILQMDRRVGNPLGLPERLCFDGLETVRLRRLPFRTSTFEAEGSGDAIEDGLTRDDEYPLVQMFESAHNYDEQEYAALESQIELPEEVRSLGNLTRRERAVMAYRGIQLDASFGADTEITIPEPLLKMQRETIPSADAGMMMLKNASNTLTSVNLDWVMGVNDRTWYLGRHSRTYQQWIGMYRKFFDLRFPSLRSFQLRNCVVAGTTIPWDILLLDSNEAEGQDENSPTLAPLAFMEAHPEIKCLAWPMSNFFSHNPSAKIRRRADVVMDNLARNLVDLRVDVKFSDHGEPLTEEGSLKFTLDRERRRRFISDFVPRLKKLTSIKIEGGMPRDERREVVRALRTCPLQKIVTIGICSPLGNTWGQNGVDVIGVVDQHDRSNLEAEDKSAVYELGPSKLVPPSDDNFTFEPSYGWEGQPPMLHTLASYHARTVRELKFCGWKGAPVLLQPTPITSPLLAPLKHFHKLESFVISIWLSTHFEGDTRDSEIISYWTDARSPTSTALMLIEDEAPQWGWYKELRTKYAPNALAWRVTNFLGPFLSEEAKSRKGGVSVRASFSVGDWGGIFDLDLRIGKGAMGSDVCLGFEGPREELETTRRRKKLDSRRWF